ncbi:retrovirus-related pol polyprotein from transposon TNT 1-94 [Tanacetum coccineum]
MTGQRSQLINFVSKFLGTVRFGNDQIAKIMGYSDYQLENVTISRVYYVEGLGHNLFSVGQFCDSDLEVAFRKHRCYIRNLDGADLLSGSRDTNLYTISLDDMLKSSLICLLSKASKTKSWLWHRRLSHLNFGKSKKSSHKPKAVDTNQEKLSLLHMDLCGPMRVESINGKKYILVIVDDYSQFTWVKFLRSKDEAPEIIIKCLKQIQVRMNATVRNVRTGNGTEFVNRTLRDYYENVGITHETSVARTPQRNGVVERRNRTLVEAARCTICKHFINYTTRSINIFQGVAEQIENTHFDDPCYETLHENSVSQGADVQKEPALFEYTPVQNILNRDSSSQESSSNVQLSHTPFELLG